jgi:hypothetical protein
MKTFFLSLAAGILGGILSHYVWTQPVLAQSQAAPPKEVRAQNLVIVNEKNEVQGVFSFEQPQVGPSRILLFDSRNHEIWSAGGPPVRPLSSH